MKDQIKHAKRITGARARLQLLPTLDSRTLYGVLYQSSIAQGRKATTMYKRNLITLFYT